ncbi:hypothetical protein DRE_06994 [Drechslerella stenobrocha 248]|uniref:Uncharacterized protein n=1 Tax=Drechslerella stenobrocha 248 TaxID=1043628 RepID=W7HM45_9PEZI|nr:hypothetical protein DRE_06994 [Drechslerella stenobrocha 248]
MASFAQLPDELRRLLETATAPATFASTATKFLDAVPNPEQHFARACEILITLTTAIAGARRLLPSSDVRGGEGPPAVDIGEGGCRRPAEEGELADLSAKDFYTGFEQLRLGESTDLRTFAEEEETPIQAAWSTAARHDQPHKQGSNGHYGSASRSRSQQKPAAAGSTPSPAPGQSKQPVFAHNHPMPVKSKDVEANRSFAVAEETVPRAVVEDALANAHIRHLTAAEKNVLLGNMALAARIYPPAPDPEPYRRMLDLNFDILQPLTVEILRVPDQRDPARTALLNAVLPKLNLELRSLDLINHLALRPARDEASAAAPKPAPASRGEKTSSAGAPLTAASNDSKPSVLTTAERTHLLHVFISNCILQLEAPYGDMDGIPATARRAKGPDVARKVKLLCMFITNLLTREVVTAQELYFEMQNIYMGFTTFKEARELWTNATGSRGVGIGFVGM